MPPTDRRRANLVIGLVVGLSLTAGLGWMALKTTRPMQQASLPANVPVFEAEWLRLPTPEDVIRVYPDKARSERIEDRALVEMRCVIAADGRLEGCAIFNDSLPGYGFAQAALELSDRFEIKTIARDGSSLVGLPVTVPMAFDALFAPAAGEAKP